jgi:L-ascorbate metabolism protein UlaG (beta-lactamase superfamily)
VTGIFFVLILFFILTFFSPVQGRGKGSGLEITWIGHSCFEIRFFDFRILVDPHTPEWFEYSRPEGRYDLVFASHKAADHFHFDGLDADVFLLASGAEDAFIRQKNPETEKWRGKITRTKINTEITFWTVASYHDDQKGAVEGVNGILCFDLGGIKIGHLGDLGHVLEEEQLIKIGSVDILMIPVDGYYTIDIATAKTIIHQLNPSIVFPMHYKTEKSDPEAPVYTEKDILKGFPGAKRIRQSTFIIDDQWLNQNKQVIIPDYLHQKRK